MDSFDYIHFNTEKIFLDWRSWIFFQSETRPNSQIPYNVSENAWKKQKSEVLQQIGETGKHGGPHSFIGKPLAKSIFFGTVHWLTDGSNLLLALTLENHS